MLLSPCPVASAGGGQLAFSGELPGCRESRSPSPLPSPQGEGTTAVPLTLTLSPRKGNYSGPPHPCPLPKQRELQRSPSPLPSPQGKGTTLAALLTGTKR